MRTGKGTEVIIKQGEGGGKGLVARWGRGEREERRMKEGQRKGMGKGNNGTVGAKWEGREGGRKRDMDREKRNWGKGRETKDK